MKVVVVTEQTKYFNMSEANLGPVKIFRSIKMFDFQYS